MKGFWPWLKRALVGLLSLLIVAAGAGFAYQAYSTKRTAERFPPPGKLVDIGGYRLHLNCTGEGSPTAILESGGGFPSLDFSLVQAEVGKFTGVCSYDRAGLGWSEAGPLPKDGDSVAIELKSLLGAAGIAGPYVLVGHSFGGLYVRIFAAHNREDVSGMILLDPSHEDQYNRLPEDVKQAYAQQRAVFDLLLRSAPVIVPIGLHRLLGYCSEPMPPNWKSAESEFNALRCRTPHMTATAESFLNFQQTGMQAKAAGSFGDIPLRVVSSDQHPPELLPVLAELHEELAQLSANGSRTVAKGCGHEIQIDCPQIVVAEIHKMVETARQRIYDAAQQAIPAPK